MSALRPIRVLHTIAGLGGGGSERWLTNIVRLSDPSQVQHNVFVLYPDLGGSPVFDKPLHARGILNVSRSGLRNRALAALARRGRARKKSALYERFSFISRCLLCVLALPRAIRLVRHFRPHVLHVHTVPDLLLGVLLKIIFRCPLVNTVPAVFSHLRMEGISWLPDFYRRAHGWIDVFSAGENRTELLEIGIPEEKILYDLGGVELHPQCSDKNECCSTRLEFLRALHLPHDTLLALSAGRLYPEKGHHLAIDVITQLVAEMPQLHLIIIGGGPERRTLEDHARQAGVSNRVHFLGFILDPREIFETADIYFRTTIFEPENLAFYEAMAAGLPAVGFDTGWPDLITKVGHGRLVAMQDTGAFAAAVSQILERPDRGSSLGSLARDHALAHLNVQSSVNILTATYLRLASPVPSNFP